MKRLLTIGVTFLLALSLWYCAPDRSAEPDRVAQFGWTEVFATDGGVRLLGANGNADTTDAFLIRNYRGAVTAWFDFDSTSAGNSGAGGTTDSCVTVSLELRNELTGEWGKAYNNITKLDTIARALANVGASSADVYMLIANFNDTRWGWADSARLILEPGIGDSNMVAVYIGGQ